MGRILHGKFRREATKILEVVAEIPSKRLRNMLAGYITRQIKKLQGS